MLKKSRVVYAKPSVSNEPAVASSTRSMRRSVQPNGWGEVIPEEGFWAAPQRTLIPYRGSGPLPMPIPLRGDLAVIGPMARSAADLALELSVLAGPDPLTEGVGYKLALPPPRYARLADFHLLV